VEETDEAVELVERVAALDLGKATLTCCIRIPHETDPARRRQEVNEYSTTTRSLLGLADRLRSHGVTLVAMEATSDYWKPAVRHEVPRVRAEVEGLRLRSVAAGR
jgi:transposase